MSSERLWRELTDNKIPWPSSHLAQSCENELQELMLQIDKMIKEKTVEWERSQEAVRSKLALKEQECQLMHSTLEERAKEAGKLRSQLEEVVKSKKTCRAEYEAQVGYLRQEVQNMTRQYDRLRRKLEKQSRQLDREKERVTDCRQSDAGERRQLERQMEDAVAERAELERARSALAQKAETAEAARQALEEKCVFLQAQTQTYQKQLDKRKQILESSEVEFQAQLSNLEEQLRSARDGLSQQLTTAERLKKTLETTTEEYKATIDAKELLERDLRASKQTTARMEDDLRRMASEMSRKEKQVVRAEHELSGRLEELRMAQDALRRKSEALGDLELQRCREGGPGEMIRLREELDALREAGKAAKKSDRRLQDDLAATQARLADLEKYNAQLLQRLQKAKDSGLQAQSYELASTKDELRKAREALSESEEAHSSSLARLRRSNAEMDETMASAQRKERDLSERLASSDRRLRVAYEDGDRMAAELHVANAQLEALRLENRHLRAPRDSAEREAPSGGGGWSCESGSERLSSEEPVAVIVPPPRGVRLVRQQEETPDTVKLPPPSPPITAWASPSAEQLSSLSRRVTELTADKETMARELETQVETLKRLSLENKAMAKFVSGVSHALSTSPRRTIGPGHTPGPFGDFQLSAAGSRGLLRQLNNNSIAREEKTRRDSVEDEVESLRSLLKATSFSALELTSASDSEASTDPTVARFLSQERERSLELEQLLNTHIEDLKKETERTLADYRRELAEGDGASSSSAS